MPKIWADTAMRPTGLCAPAKGRSCSGRKGRILLPGASAGAEISVDKAVLPALQTLVAAGTRPFDGHRAASLPAESVSFRFQWKRVILDTPLACRGETLGAVENLSLRLGCEASCLSCGLS